MNATCKIDLPHDVRYFPPPEVTPQAAGTLVVPQASIITSPDVVAAFTALKGGVIAFQAPSVAADVATLKTDFNALLTKLIASGLMASS